MKLLGLRRKLIAVAGIVGGSLILRMNLNKLTPAIINSSGNGGLDVISLNWGVDAVFKIVVLSADIPVRSIDVDGHKQLYTGVGLAFDLGNE
jgi:hypothetical protein